MDRRTFLALLGVPAVAALAASCGDDPSTGDDGDGGPTDGGRPEGNGVDVRSDLERVVADPALATDATLAVADIGHDLYRSLAIERPTGNLVTSPVSVAVALSMVAAGAAGVTRDELLRALADTDPTVLHRSMNAMTAALDARNTDDLTLRLANSVWGQAGRSFGEPFLDLLATEYGAGLGTVDYVDDTEGAREPINAWVAERTEDRIPELIAEGVLTPDSRLTLVNAVYLRAPWQLPFAESNTQDRPFTLDTGETVDHPRMRRTGTFPFAAGDGWVSVELPFGDGSLSMVVLLPEPGFLEYYQQTFLVSEATDYSTPTYVAVELPRFDAGSVIGLGSALQSLGVVTPFTTGADFSPMSTEEDLFLSAVVHAANITVDERGAEAAAATAAVMEATSAPVDDPIEVVVDRPFLFAIRDVPTGTLLFLGRITDPRG